MICSMPTLMINLHPAKDTELIENKIFFEILGDPDKPTVNVWVGIADPKTLEVHEKTETQTMFSFDTNDHDLGQVDWHELLMFAETILNFNKSLIRHNR